MKILNFCFDSWYETFKNHTIPSRILNIPPKFIEYLLSDGIFLPLSADGDEYTPYRRDTDSDYDDDSTDGYSTSQDLENDPANLISQHPDIIEFGRLIDMTIYEMGTFVFPKLDMSSPRDATWMMTNGDLKCKSSSDIFLLLKSSDFISFDLERLREEDENYGFHLVLREWKDVNPAFEFRCFVKENHLISISQRDYQSYYEYLPSLKETILANIRVFWKDKVRNVFHEENYVFDVYLELSSRTGTIRKTWILDFNPWMNETDTLLFSWDEVEEMKPIIDQTEIRIIHSEEEAAYYKSHGPKFISNMMPHDALMMAQGTTVNGFAATLANELKKRI